jgi:alpha-beta hydrolase superfamily lysophospholipase
VTSVGYHETEDVAAAFREFRRVDTKGRVVLYGTSMGAVAVLRAVSKGWAEPESLILECPFDRFTTTIGNRFEWMGLPRFPFAPAVAGWVGLQQGFNGLAHNPAEYARQIRCPTLLLQGELDESVGRASVRAVSAALGKRTTFELIPNAGHAFLATRAPEPWRRSVRAFLGRFSSPSAVAPQQDGPAFRE